MSCVLKDLYPKNSEKPLYFWEMIIAKNSTEKCTTDAGARIQCEFELSPIPN